MAPSAGLGHCRTFATCVGKRNCPAQYYLNDVEVRAWFAVYLFAFYRL